MQDEDNTTGAIDTGDDNSGAAPVMGGAPTGGDNSGAAPVLPPAEPENNGEGGSGFGQSPQPDLAATQTPAKKIIAYLMGADAAHPDVLQQGAQAVDPQGQMSPGDRNLMAVDAAREKGGDQAAWALLQSNRVAYNAQTAFAKTALQGTPQKPADLKAAIDAANKAQANVLDGSNIQFSPSQGGVTATVTMHGTTQPQTIPLSVQQFAQFLDVGGDGQWDKVMDQSAPATLQRIAQAQPQAQGAAATAQGGTPTLNPRKPQWPTPQGSAPAAPQDQQEAPAKPAPTSFGKTPSSINLSGSDAAGTPPEDQTHYGEELEARSKKIFPSDQAAANQWMAAQEEQELKRQNAIDVAGETGRQRIEVAKATGGSRVEAAKINAEGKLKGWQYSSDQKLAAAKAQLQAKIEQNASKGAGDAQNRLLKLVQTKIMSGQPLTPQEQAQVDTLPGAAAAGAQQQAAPQRQAPAQAAAPAQSSQSPQDQQALSWANANPNDPRAAQIKQRLGVQ